ncbi:MAG TPA: GAF domain-containing protein [Terriglobales bacterium]|nr:GAF domain-containing protein [Terriglobales bacterium]
MDQHAELLAELRTFAATAASAQALMQHISDTLHEKMVRYNWVGFYLIDPSDPSFLVLGPFAGSFTPHGRIPLDEGLCGACAASGKTVLVQDVTKDLRYLQGSQDTKSEMVAPVLVQGRVAGELDINSYFANTFGPTDRQFVEACAALVAEHLAGHPAG